MTANIVALNEPLLYNRMGAGQPAGMIFALQSDVVPQGFTGAKSPEQMPTPDQLEPGKVMLRLGKRPRPVVLRVNQGQCLRVEFTNLLSIPQPSRDLPPQFNPVKGNCATSANPCTSPDKGIQPSCPAAAADGGPTCGTMPGMGSQGVTQMTGITAGVTVLGLQPVFAKGDDALLCKYSPLGQKPPDGEKGVPTLCNSSFAGSNQSSLIPPQSPVKRTNGRYYNIAYTYYAAKEGGYLLYSGGQTWTGLNSATQLSVGLFGAVNVQPALSEWYRSQLTADEFSNAATLQKAADNKPYVKVNYGATYPSDYRRPDGTWVRKGTPVMKMLHNGEIIATDINAVVTGPNQGLLPIPPDKREDFCTNPKGWNPAYPNPCKPYREFTVIYHEDFQAVQAFAAYNQPGNDLLANGGDLFAINYGTGGITSQILANRLPVKGQDGKVRMGTGPSADCTECKFEEFFLSSWTGGDPAMPVDRPVNMADPSKPATKALYPDDPSNVHHSYLGDNVRFRVLHAGQLHHIHHLHAHQWLFSQNDSNSAYLDSQAIGPGSAYTQDIAYGGGGNRNRTPGDAIFHCHFYPHFAAGMWELWRVHDVFEMGSKLDSDGRVAAGSRALPDGEIQAGTPIPAVTPLPTMAEAPLPAPACVEKGQISTRCSNPLPQATSNLGFPFFIPGIVGHRAPHPPLDFAVQDGKELNGGLPRHVVETSPQNNAHMPEGGFTPRDFNKDLESLAARQLPEDGTSAEKAAMKFNNLGSHASFTPEGKAGAFLTNGQESKPGAPFANPCGREFGWSGSTRIYKAAAIETDVVLTKKGWHYPQQRMLSLWEDVQEYFYKGSKKPPEPLFIRANSGECVEYWHTNLVPNVFLLDDFQVRTPTDILGQHIHLVKFDVLASDGAGNGWNYEDGTFSPNEVVERINAINHAGGLKPSSGGKQVRLTPELPPKEICGKLPNCQDWSGAQTTVQRWLADPVKNDEGEDRTLRTVFTHDHFGPSTHQQVGLYAGLLVEPANTLWLDPITGARLGNRKDGGPTSFQANIIADPKTPPQASFEPYREFAMMFQDSQFAYQADSIKEPKKIPGVTGVSWADPTYALNAAVANSTLEKSELPSPDLVTAGPGIGVSSINYRAEPLPLRVNPAKDCPSGVDPMAQDSSHVFRSITRCDSALNSQPDRYDPLTLGVHGTDPYTPLLRAYQGDNVQVRLLVGAHVNMHSFTINGVNWLSEPSSKNSGFRGAQSMGLSEHFELAFKMPKAKNKVADYLYKADNQNLSVSTGLWGLLRGYGELQKDSSGKSTLEPLPNNLSPERLSMPPTCPPKAPIKKFHVAVSTAKKLLANRKDINKEQLVFSPRGPHRGCNVEEKFCWANGATCSSDSNCPDTESGVQAIPDALMYVRWEDLDAAKQHLRENKSIEPLVLRANAGDCVEVTLTNLLQANDGPIRTEFNYWLANASFLEGAENVMYMPNMAVSGDVGLHPQLVSYDVSQGDGANAGMNPVQTVSPLGDKGAVSSPVQLASLKVGSSSRRTYVWYMGRMKNGEYQPVEFGAINLLPADPLGQPALGLAGALIVEPQGARAYEDPNTRTSATVVSGGKRFREFVAIFQDALQYTESLSPTSPTQGAPSGKAINYGAAPFSKVRYPSGKETPTDTSCVLSNRMAQAGYTMGDPSTPVFSVPAGMEVRFRMLHATLSGSAPSVVTIANHAWPFLPYVDDSKQIGLDSRSSSNWTGSQMGHSASSHFDVVLPSAGGPQKVPGDYVLENFNMSFTKSGSWALMRVSEKSDAVAITNIVKTSSGKVVVQGVNGVTVDDAEAVMKDPNPNKRFAPEVSLYATADCSGSPIASAAVGADGGWSVSPPGMSEIPKVLCAMTPSRSRNTWVSSVPGACLQPSSGANVAQTTHRLKSVMPLTPEQREQQRRLENLIKRKTGMAPRDE